VHARFLSQIGGGRYDPEDFEGGFMDLDRRRFLAASGAVAASSLSGTGVLGAPSPSASRSASLFLTEDDGLQPATFDRMPLEWHQGRLKILQERLRERSYAGLLLRDRWNIIYFTGLYFTTTERPFYVYLPADRLAAIWFYPSLDRDLVSRDSAVDQHVLD